MKSCKGSYQKQAGHHIRTSYLPRAGAPKRLFNFNPADIIGRPVASIVDVFGYWRNQFGGDGSLFTLLAFDSMKEALPTTSNGSHRVTGTSWRVGVHVPVKRDEDIASAAAEAASRLQKEVCDACWCCTVGYTCFAL